MSLSIVLLAVLAVLVAVTVTTGVKVKKASKTFTRQNGHRTEMFIRDRIAAHGRFYRLKKKLFRLVVSVAVVMCLLISSLFTSINVDINLVAKQDTVSDASYTEGPYIEGVSIDGPIEEQVHTEVVDEEEVAMNASMEARQAVDTWVNRWIDVNNYNDTALTYADDVASSDRAETVTQELSNGWTRVSAIGFDYVVVREYKAINCEVVYINYVLPLGDWLELDMEDMDLPFVHYYESTKYDYVKSCYCTDLEDDHTYGYERISHIVSTRKEVR